MRSNFLVLFFLLYSVKIFASLDLKVCIPNNKVAIKVSNEIIRGQDENFKEMDWNIKVKESPDSYELNYKYNCPKGRKCLRGHLKLKLRSKDCALLNYYVEK